MKPKLLWPPTKITKENFIELIKNLKAYLIKKMYVLKTSKSDKEKIEKNKIQK